MKNTWKRARKAALTLAALAMGAIVGTVTCFAGETVLLFPHYLHESDPDTYQTYGTGYYQGIRLGEELVNVWPKLAGALADFSQEREEEITSYFNDIVEARKEFDAFEYEASAEESLILRRADEKAFSFLSSYSTYAGGAHGYHSFTGNNYDPQTGEELQLSDIIPNDAELRGVVEEELMAAYPEIQLLSVDGSNPISGYGYQEDMTPFNWSMGPQALTIWFNPYDIAAYAVGILKVDIPFAKYPELFSQDYTQQGSYCYEMVTWPVETYDLNGDGEGDSIGITPQTGDYGETEGLKITVNGQECMIGDNYSYSQRPLLMHLEDGRTYLYIDCISDNDYHIMECVKLEADGGEYLGHISSGFAGGYDQQSETYYLMIPVKPDSFRLSTRSDVLGTYSIARDYQIGEDGMPQPFSEWYDADSHPTMTVKKELSGQAVDADTGELTGEEAAFAAGDQVHVIRTNGEDMADLQSTDGKTIRITVQTDQWPHLINGEDEDEYLDGLMYAG